jgi:hypothetical protein
VSPLPDQVRFGCHLLKKIQHSTQRSSGASAAIWHNNKTGAPITRSLIAYDH